MGCGMCAEGIGFAQSKSVSHTSNRSVRVFFFFSHLMVGTDTWQVFRISGIQIAVI